MGREEKEQRQNETITGSVTIRDRNQREMKNKKHNKQKERDSVRRLEEIMG